MNKKHEEKTANKINTNSNSPLWPPNLNYKLRGFYLVSVKQNSFLTIFLKYNGSMEEGQGRLSEPESLRGLQWNCAS